MNKRLNSKRALTLIETIISVVVMTIIFVALMPALSASLQQTTVAGQRSQAIKIVNYLSQRVMNKDWRVTPRYTTTTKEWDYGVLGRQFSELYSGNNISNLDNYRAEVYSAGNVHIPGMWAGQYDISVCFNKAGQEYCSKASAFGRWAQMPPSPPPPPSRPNSPNPPRNPIPGRPNNPTNPGSGTGGGGDGNPTPPPPPPPPYIN